MAALVDHKKQGVGFSNESRIVRVTYDFAVDGGATAALDVLTADGPMLIAMKSLWVETACTSGGSATLDLGVTGALTIFRAATAVASLGANVILSMATAGTVRYLASGEQVLQEIKVQAFTAGKIHYTFEIWKAKA